MPDVLDMIAQNPEMAQSLVPPTPAAPVLNPVDPAAAANDQSQLSRIPAFVQARSARAAQILAAPDLQGSIEAHHQAVADATALHHQAAQELAYYTAAKALHDTGAYHQAMHGIDVTRPDFYQYMTDQAIAYPHAKPDPELMKPIYEARKVFEDANGYKAQQEQEKLVREHIEKGNLTDADAQNPRLRNADGSMNIRALIAQGAANAGLKAAAKLTPEEEEEFKAAHTDPHYAKKVLQATDNPADPKYDPTLVARKAVFWRANGKLTPSTAPVGSSPATAPVTKSNLYNF